MLTISEIINARKRLQKKPDDSELRQLPYKHAFIYGRVSSPAQIRDSRESIREIAKLVRLAKEDGYKTSISTEKVEEWLLSILKGTAQKGIMEDWEVTVDVQDLGLSGQLSSEERKGMASLQQRIKDCYVGAVYLTEGVSRLSRDRDRILPYQLLKLLKEHQCRIRTLEGIWNPAIERDWDYLAEEFENAIGELKVMNRRMCRRKAQKAGRGEFVGEPVPAGFILPVTGQKPNGEYEYGKMEPYPAHAEVVKHILEEFIRQGGSGLKTVRAMGDVVIPFFPPELNYMERLTALRRCPKQITGYKITPTLIRGLATNPKLIGVWQWGNNEAIENNHQPAVPQELFLEAYELATRPGKPKGKAVNFEPMEWSGLLWCTNHSEPRLISGHSSEGRYICDRDYHLGEGPICLDISGRFIDDPLTTVVLRQLDFTPYAEEVLSRLESDVSNGKLERIRHRQQIARLEQELKKWQALLPCCVNRETGRVDREREEFYWNRIREAQRQLEELRAKPVSESAQVTADFTKVKDFLKGLSQDWRSYSRTLRNRLLKLLIEKVELRGTYDIEVTITWKAGFQQRIVIHRPQAKSRRERHWTGKEDGLLRILYPSSSTDIIMAALPDRSWRAITLRALRLKLKRKRHYHAPRDWRPWTQEEDERLKLSYEAGIPLKEIACELRRSIASIGTRAANKRLRRPPSIRWVKSQISWEIHDLIPLQGQSSGRG